MSSEAGSNSSRGREPSFEGKRYVFGMPGQQRGYRLAGFFHVSGPCPTDLPISLRCSPGAGGKVRSVLCFRAAACGPCQFVSATRPYAGKGTKQGPLADLQKFQLLGGRSRASCGKKGKTRWRLRKRPPKNGSRARHMPRRRDDGQMAEVILGTDIFHPQRVVHRAKGVRILNETGGGWQLPLHGGVHRGGLLRSS